MNLNQLSQFSKDQIINNENTSDSVVKLNPVNKLNEVVDDLIQSFKEYKQSLNKREIIKEILKNQDIVELMEILLDAKQTEICMYLLEIMRFPLVETYEKLFFLGIEHNNFNFLEFLINNNNNLLVLSDALDKEGNNGLIRTVIESNIHIAKLLLKHDPSLIEAKNKHNIDSITIAVYNNDNLMFFLLINNIDYVLLNVAELCKIAIRNENFEILDYLTDKYYSVLFNDNTLLHHCCTQKSLRVFDLIAKHTKNLQERDDHGEIPLHWAVMKGTYNIVEELLNYYKKFHLEVDIKSKYGLTPFHLACIKEDKNLVKLLFDHGANVNELDEKGNSVIHMVASTGNEKWMKHLIKHYNCNCFLKNQLGNTPFMIACLNGYTKIAEYFIDIMPNLNWKNKNGQTALHAAVFSNNFEILTKLLNKKADLSIKDINALTAYHYAYIEKKAEIIKLIHQILKIDKFES